MAATMGVLNSRYIQTLLIGTGPRGSCYFGASLVPRKSQHGYLIGTIWSAGLCLR